MTGHKNNHIPSEWFVYILQCSDDSYYIGHTEDLRLRIAAHNRGEGAIYTSSRTPVVLKYQESHSTKESAIKREAQLKKWSRVKKQALIHGYMSELKKLSKCRQNLPNS